MTSSDKESQDGERVSRIITDLGRLAARDSRQQMEGRILALTILVATLSAFMIGRGQMPKEALDRLIQIMEEIVAQDNSDQYNLATLEAFRELQEAIDTFLGDQSS